MPVIRISDKSYEILVKYKSKIEAISKKSVSISKVADMAIELLEPLTEDDAAEILRYKGKDDRRYASLLATAYAVKESKSWSSVMAELRSECGADVDSATDEQLKCIIRYLEPKVGLSSETPAS